MLPGSMNTICMVAWQYHSLDGPVMEGVPAWERPVHAF